MSVKRRPLLLAGLLAAGSAPLLLTLALQGSPASPAMQSQRQVADDLDKIVQPRFQDASAGKFGMSRLVPAVNGHQAVGFQGYFRTENPTEAALLARADAANRPYVLAFLHCAHVPGKPDAETPSPTFTLSSPVLPRLITITVRGGTLKSRHYGFSDGMTIRYVRETEPALQSAALRVLPSVMKGRNAQATSDHWTLFLRPVRALHSSCLTCHTTAKYGDTLGVMVYAVGDTVRKP